MPCLIYSVFRHIKDGPDSLPPGVSGHAVHALEQDGMWVAYSRGEDQGCTDITQKALQFFQVNDALFRMLEIPSILPFRYQGVVMPESSILTWVHRHREHLRRILDEVHGCVEMGLRLLKDRDEDTPPSSEADHPPEDSSGLAYLRSRKKAYHHQIVDEENLEKVFQSITAHFAGHYLSLHTEGMHGKRLTLPGLNFLIDQDCRTSFEDRFHALSLPDWKVMMTGPWPPYNFVSQEVVDYADRG